MSLLRVSHDVRLLSAILVIGQRSLTFQQWLGFTKYRLAYNNYGFNGTLKAYMKKLRRYPQQQAVLFIVLAPPHSPPRTSWNAWWNPGGTLVEPYLRAAPGPPRSLSGLRPQSFQLLGKKKSITIMIMLLMMQIITQH